MYLAWGSYVKECFVVHKLQTAHSFWRMMQQYGSENIIIINGGLANCNNAKLWDLPQLGY